jgi:hypothetical protein
MARKKRNQLASGIGAVDAPNGSESTLDESEVDNMEEQELCLCGLSTESCGCKHKCEFDCNDEECLCTKEPVPFQEQVAEPVVVVEEVVVQHTAVVDPVIVPAEPEHVAAKPVAETAVVASPLSQSQTANKFNSILGEKTAHSRRYLGGRGTRY